MKRFERALSTRFRCFWVFSKNRLFLFSRVVRVKRGGLGIYCIQVVVSFPRVFCGWTIGMEPLLLARKYTKCYLQDQHRKMLPYRLPLGPQMAMVWCSNESSHVLMMHPHHHPQPLSVNTAPEFKEFKKKKSACRSVVIPVSFVLVDPKQN